MTLATSGNIETVCLGKHMVDVTECLLTHAVKPHTATDTVSNHLKGTSAKHCGSPREVQTTTTDLLSTKRGGTRLPFSAPPRLPKTLEQQCN